LKVYEEIKEENSEGEEEGKIPELKVGERLNLLELKPRQHFTKPPARFTEASLIKELEANGIGRPSTYAQIVTTIKQRKYITSENRKLFPTELGFTVNKILVENFPEIFNVKFTANMESELDKIEEGEDEWTKVLKDFYVPFESTLKKVEQGEKEIKEKLIEKTDEVCEKCGKPMVIKWSKNGRFLACSGFPDCKNTKPLFTKEEEQIIKGEKCERCGAEMVLKNGKFGRFLACSKYPDCKNTKPLSLGIECPEKDCGGFLVEKRSRRGKVFYGCSNYPRCNFATWDKPVAFECPQCQAKIMVEKKSKSKGEYLKCIRCGHEKKVEVEVVQ
jgi:DNA topoisomerase-1